MSFFFHIFFIIFLVKVSATPGTNCCDKYDRYYECGDCRKIEFYNETGITVRLLSTRTIRVCVLTKTGFIRMLYVASDYQYEILCRSQCGIKEVARRTGKERKRCDTSTTTFSTTSTRTTTTLPSTSYSTTSSTITSTTSANVSSNTTSSDITTLSTTDITCTTPQLKDSNVTTAILVPVCVVLVCVILVIYAKRLRVFCRQRTFNGSPTNQDNEEETPLVQFTSPKTPASAPAASLPPLSPPVSSRTRSKSKIPVRVTL